MISDGIKRFGLSMAYDYIEKNPEKNIARLMEWVDRFAGEGPDTFPQQRAAVRNVINDPSSNWYQLIMRIFRDTDNDVLKTFFTNFVLNANLIGWKVQEENRKKYNCNVPWAILLDPTSACNLHCTGCCAVSLYGRRYTFRQHYERPA